MLNKQVGLNSRGVGKCLENLTSRGSKEAGGGKFESPYLQVRYNLALFVPTLTGPFIKYVTGLRGRGVKQNSDKQ